MRILFIVYNHLNSNSGIHIYNLATQLVLLGNECVVCVPTQKEKIILPRTVIFSVIGAEELKHCGKEKDFDIIHVWTPREVVRKITENYLQSCNGSYLVHLEDNEELLLERYTKIPFWLLQYLPSMFLSLLIRPYMIHPRKYRSFLENSIGLTVIIDKLKEYCPKDLPVKTIWAGYQEDLMWDTPKDSVFASSLGIVPEDLVIVYTGNIHVINQDEVLNLYKAVELLNNRGIRTKLLRTGMDVISLNSDNVLDIKEKYSIELGYVQREKMPSVLALGDILVQPGSSDAFNDYRFPSKLPEFLASSKPVILPKTNIGNVLKNKKECLFLENGSPSDIAQKIEILYQDKKLREKIGKMGQKFAEKKLKWSIIANQLQNFYYEVLSREK